ncbi:MAG: hypothetical protein QXY05_03840 [Candidatus Anstonellales archaeon]
MKKIGGGMMFLAFYLGVLGCSPYNKNISKPPPIVENLMDGTMQALLPVDCPDLEKLAEPPRIKKQ